MKEKIASDGLQKKIIDDSKWTFWKFFFYFFYPMTFDREPVLWNTQTTADELAQSVRALREEYFPGSRIFFNVTLFFFSNSAVALFFFSGTRRHLHFNKHFNKKKNKYIYLWSHRSLLVSTNKQTESLTWKERKWMHREVIWIKWQQSVWYF